MSQYAYGSDENHVTIRLRCEHNDIKKCDLYYGDRACRQTPVIFTKVEMQIIAFAELYDYFQADLEDPYKRLVITSYSIHYTKLYDFYSDSSSILIHILFQTICHF